MKNPIMIKQHKELQNVLRNRTPVEINYDLFLMYLFEEQVIFKEQVLNDVLISHAYQENDYEYSQRIYFFEKEFNHVWRYYAQLAESFHTSESDIVMEYFQKVAAAENHTNSHNTYDIT